MPNALILQHPLASIQGFGQDKPFFIDCLLSDSHTFDSDVTEFPVESGSTISDNIRNKPLVVTMECVVTNSPIGQLVSLRDKVSDPADSAYDLLLKIRSDRQLVTITTSLRTYIDMALQGLTIPRESGRGDELKFTATFKQVELVTNRREKRVAIVGAQSKGPRTLTPVEDTTSGYVYVDPKTNTWWDYAIGAWRASVTFKEPASVVSNGSSTAISGGAPGKVFITAGCPEIIDIAVYDNETVGEHTAAILKPRIVKLQGGHTGSPFTPGFGARTARNLIKLAPGQYQIVRLE